MVQGALLIISAELMFVSMGASIRMVSAELSNANVVFFRNLIGLSILLPLMLRNPLSRLRTDVPHLHLLRAVAGLSAMYCFFYAIAHMPLAEAMLLKLSSPLFIPVVAFFWLSEPVPWRLRLAIGGGFIGVALVLRPDFGAISPVAWVALSGGLFAAVAKVTVRRLSRTEPATRIVFYFALIGTLVSCVPMLWYGQIPSAHAALWLLAIGLFSTTGQLLMTRGLSMAAAARMGVFGFFSVIFAAAYGWIFWQEALRWSTLAGASIVVLAGVMVSRTGERPAPPASSPDIRNHIRH